MRVVLCAGMSLGLGWVKNEISVTGTALGTAGLAAAAVLELSKLRLLRCRTWAEKHQPGEKDELRETVNRGK